MSAALAAAPAPRPPFDAGDLAARLVLVLVEGSAAGVLLGALREVGASLAPVVVAFVAVRFVAWLAISRSRAGTLAPLSLAPLSLAPLSLAPLSLAALSALWLYLAALILWFYGGSR